ncbi:MAG: c-type cytochrome domain-containing protein [Bacteroidota bacterium]
MKTIAILICALCLISPAQEKKAKISFKNDILPIITKKCMNCHNTEDESPSGLYMDDYSELMKGESRHGPVIKPKKGEESVLIMKLRGTASFGKQMPRGKKPLDDDMIEMISTWIDQGAKNN